MVYRPKWLKNINVLSYLYPYWYQKHVKSSLYTCKWTKKRWYQLNTDSNSLETVKFRLFAGSRRIHLGKQFFKMFNTGLLSNWRRNFPLYMTELSVTLAIEALQDRQNRNAYLNDGEKKASNLGLEFALLRLEPETKETKHSGSGHCAKYDT